jgi:uncharacterized protein YjbJ (UPF0337 family)
VNVSASGAATTDHPNRGEGQWNQTVGSAKEMLGNLTGAEGLRREGVEQNREGKGQEAHGQLSDLGHGTGKCFFLYLFPLFFFSLCFGSVWLPRGPLSLLFFFFLFFTC